MYKAKCTKVLFLLWIISLHEHQFGDGKKSCDRKAELVSSSRSELRQIGCSEMNIHKLLFQKTTQLIVKEEKKILFMEKRKHFMIGEWFQLKLVRL